MSTIYLHLCMEIVCSMLCKEFTFKLPKPANKPGPSKCDIRSQAARVHHFLHQADLPYMPPNIRQQLAIYNSLLKHVSVLFLRSLISMSYNYSSLGGCARISCAYCIMPWSASCAFASTFAVNLCHAAQAQSSLKTPLEQKHA